MLYRVPYPAPCVTALNTVTFMLVSGQFLVWVSRKRLLRRLIWDRPHGVKAGILTTLQLRVQDPVEAWSPVSHSCPVTRASSLAVAR